MKRIKFSLEMKDGNCARSMDELRSNFSIIKIIEHLNSGKLEDWLIDRYEEQIVDELKKISVKTPDFSKIICELFSVEYKSEYDQIVKTYINKIEKLEEYKNQVDIEKYKNNINEIAFNQDDLDTILSEDIKTIFLCGNEFFLNDFKEDLHFIGIIDDVKITLESNLSIDFSKLQTNFKNCIFDNKNNELVDKNSKILTLDSSSNEELKQFVKTLKTSLKDLIDKNYENNEVKKYNCHSLYMLESSVDAVIKAVVGFKLNLFSNDICMECGKQIRDKVYSKYSDEKNKLIINTREYYKPLEMSIINIGSNFLKKYLILAKTWKKNQSLKTYLDSCSNHYKEIITNETWKKEIGDIINNKNEELIKKYFINKESKGLKVDKLLSNIGFGTRGYIIDVKNYYIDYYEKILETATSEYFLAFNKMILSVSKIYIGKINDFINEIEHKGDI